LAGDGLSGGFQRLARIAAHPAQDLDALLPWNWRPEPHAANAA
jgi:hypothetical protein